MVAPVAVPSSSTATRLRWSALVVVLGWAITVLPPVYAPRVLVGVAVTVGGLVMVPIAQMPAPVLPIARAWFFANLAALALPVAGWFGSWSNSTLMISAAVAAAITLHLAPMAGRRLAGELGDDQWSADWTTDLKVTLAADATVAVTAGFWAADAAAGAVVLAGLAVTGAGVAVGLYAWAAIRVGVDAARFGDWLRGSWTPSN